MAVDEDTVGYTIGGRKYIGWKDVKQALKKIFYAEWIDYRHS